MLLATILCVATPIKIWNTARIEHRLEEQEKLLLAAKIEALASQINPHFLFNTLASISSLVRTQPDTARMLISKLSGLLRRLMRSTDHFVTLSEELESIDEYLDIEVVRFGPQLRVDKEISPSTLDVIVPSMILQPLVENSIKHGLARKVGGGRITIRTMLRDGHAVIEVHDDGLGMSEERLGGAMSGGIGLSNVNERLRTIYGAQLPAEADERAGPRHLRQRRDSGAGRPGTGHRMKLVRWTCARLIVDDEQLARDELGYLLGQVGGVEVIAPGRQRRRGARHDRPAPARPRLPGRPDARPDRIRGGAAAARQRPDVPHYFRDRLRSARDRGVRGERGRLPAEAGRPVAARSGAAARAAADRRRSERAGSVAAVRGISDQQLEQIVQLVTERNSRRERLALKVGERFLLVQAEEIIYASLAEESITVVTNQHVGTSNYRTLDELQARLDPSVFWRVHRSHLVNINKIKEIVPWFSRNYLLRMKDEKSTEIPVSRTQTRRLRDYLKL